MQSAVESPVAASGVRKTLVEAHGVCFEVERRRLVDAVSLELAAGECMALVGPNGAGKSTLLRLLAGDLHPTAGTVTLDGVSLSSHAIRDLAVRRAVLPQQTLLQFAFTVREVVAMGRAPHDDEPLGSRGLRAMVDWAMERTETLTIAERRFPTLSGGEQGRVSLARVLAQDTPILLLDEPTAALDIRHQQLVMEVARELAGEGAAVLAVLHDLNLAAAYADRIAVLSRGRLAAVGTPWETLTESLLAEVFECPIAVTRHPMRGCPLVLPMARD